MPPIGLGMSVARECPVFVVTSTLVPSPVPSSLYDLEYLDAEEEYKEVCMTLVAVQCRQIFDVV